MVTKRRRLAICAAICFSASAPSAIAKPALHSIFTDHAVLQRDQKIEIWGTAAPSETVIVTIERIRSEPQQVPKANGGYHCRR